MKELLLFDTSEGSDNVGDCIIMDYCQHQLLDIFKNPYFINKIPTHLEIGRKAYDFNRRSDYSIVCGTNILKTSIIFNRGWNLKLWDIINLRDICLMGVGWGNYNKYHSDPYTVWAYHKILSSKLLHSVRDSYTENKLKSIGINNVINTACPTMWRLTTDFCDNISKDKSDSVVTALTCYKQDREKDITMLKILQRYYKQLYFWPQQSEDVDYLYSLKLDMPIKILPPVLSVYDQLLTDVNIDFIGSRLHGGIRALNHARRTLIIGVDNRAVEIHKDTNLPVLDRKDIDRLDTWINERQFINIVLPEDNISRWKAQFDD